MPSMDVTKPVADANPVSLLEGEQYEFLPYDAFVEIAVVARNTTASAVKDAKVNATIYSGSDLLVQNGAVTYNDVPEEGAAVLPEVQYPNSFLYQDAAFAGERLSILASAVGAAAEVRAVVRITPSG